MEWEKIKQTFDVDMNSMQNNLHLRIRKRREKTPALINIRKTPTKCFFFLLKKCIVKEFFQIRDVF